MTVRFSHHVLNRHIAPGIEQFYEADVPDMSQYDHQSEHWVDNHFLNSVLRTSLKLPAGAYAQNYLRRAEGAFSEHALARTLTHSYLVVCCSSLVSVCRGIIGHAEPCADVAAG
jgi:hypothetical protein